MSKWTFSVIGWAMFLSVVLLVADGVTCKSAAFGRIQDIIGQWRWFNGSIVTFQQGGACEATNGFVGTWQVLPSGAYEIQWRLPGQKVQYIDTMNLSEDSRRLSGKNQLGSGVSATRMAQ